LSTSVVVRIKDADNNVVTSSTGQINVSITTQNTTLSGTVSRNAVAGVATFPGLSVTGLVGAKTIRAELGSPSLVATAGIELTFGTPTKLALTTAASGAVARQQFTTQPAVTVQDVSGNTVTNYSSQVSVAVSSSAVTLSGTTARTPQSAGVVNFDDLSLSGTVGTYTLTYSSSTLTQVTQSVSVSTGTATQIVITTQATSAVNRNDFLTQPVVVVRDADGNPVNSFTGDVVASISSSGSNSAVLTGTTTRSLSGSSTATFTNLRLDGDVGEYTLTFSSTGLTSASQAISLTNVGWQVSLMFTGKKTGGVLASMGSPGSAAFRSATLANSGADGRAGIGQGQGLYKGFFQQKGITRIAFVDGSSSSLNPTQHNNYLIYDLIESSGNESLYDILLRLDAYQRDSANFQANDSVWGSPSVKNHTAGVNGYSGTLTSWG
jgi:hypothetical protein